MFTEIGLTLSTEVKHGETTETIRVNDVKDDVMTALFIGALI